MSKRGRKNKYLTHVQPRLEDIEHWCRDGAIEVEICKQLGISTSQFAVYKNKYSELTEALKKGKEYADYQVEDSLFKRAIGYDYVDVTIEKGIVTKEITKHVSPDVTACIFWLKIESLINGETIKFSIV